MLAFAGPLAAQDEIKQLRDPDPDVRCRAAEKLAKQGAAASVPALVEALKDSDAAVVKKALRALGAIGPGAKAAIPALRALHGKGRHVMLVEAALAKIHGGR